MQKIKRYGIISVCGDAWLFLCKTAKKKQERKYPYHEEAATYCNSHARHGAHDCRVRAVGVISGLCLVLGEFPESRLWNP